jgi:hypothetical protein
MSALARQNPFAVARVRAARYRMSEREFADLIARLETFGMRGAIVGPRGHGKTTLLEDLATRLAARGYAPVLVRIPSGERELPAEARAALAAAGPRDVFLVDGAGQLSFFGRRLLAWRARRAGGLVLTAHHAGLLPTLARLETSPEILEEIVQEISGRGVAEFGRSAAELHRRHRGNLRDALRELYDACAGRSPRPASGVIRDP